MATICREVLSGLSHLNSFSLIKQNKNPFWDNGLVNDQKEETKLGYSLEQILDRDLGMAMETYEGFHRIYKKKVYPDN